MTLRLKINRRTDDKLLEQFQEDPYADITVHLNNSTLRLSTAYLALESQRIAELLPDSALDLSHLDPTAATAVLRSLYGGPLECASVGDFQLVWPVIKYLQIEEYERVVEQEVRTWLQKREGAPGSLEWVEACLKNGLLGQWIVEWLSSQHLKVLEITKNYLQLGKLSDESLNFILLQYVKKEPSQTTVVNTILENYFNRKGHSPVQYLQPLHLAPLKRIWEQHHHKLRGSRLEKMASINNLIATTVASPKRREQTSSETRVKTSTIGGYNCVSMQLNSQLFQGEALSDPKMLDIRISILSKELQQRNRKIEILRQELEELEELKLRKQKQGHLANQESLLDIALLKSRMRSRREKHLNQDINNQYALDNPCKRVMEQEQKARGTKAFSEKQL